MNSRNGNGKIKGIVWLGIIMTALTLLLGTNLAGGYMTKVWRGREIEIKVASIALDVTAEKIVSFANSISIAILQTKLENIEKGQEEIKQMIRDIRK